MLTARNDKIIYSFIKQRGIVKEINHSLPSAPGGINQVLYTSLEICLTNTVKSRIEEPSYIYGLSLIRFLLAIHNLAKRPIREGK